MHVLRMHRVRAVQERPVEFLDIAPLRRAREPCVRHHRRGVVADHAVAQARTRPLRQPPAFVVARLQSLRHLRVHLGVEEVEEREERAERVPEARVAEVHARTHLACCGTAVDGLSIRADLKEPPREKERAVEARVERAPLVLRAAFHTNAPERLVPRGTSARGDGGEVPFAELKQVAFGLFGADEARGHAHVHLLAALCRRETHHHARVLRLAGGLPFAERAVRPHRRGGERMVELQHEPVAQRARRVVLLVSAYVPLRAPAADAPTLSVHLYC